MRAYTVHAAPSAPDDPERFVFVKDGFSWPALLVPALWMLWHRLWLTLLCGVIFVLVIMWIELLFGERYALLAAALGLLLFALEANNIRRLSLEQRGWRELGSTTGRRFDEAELKFFENWTKTRSAAAAPARESLARQAFLPTRASDADEPILGLFPEPER